MSIPNFYSNIGKNTTECEQLHYRSSAGNATKFVDSKKSFIGMLKRQGYTVAKQVGNYITVNKGTESLILYFAWHNSKNTNYLVNKYITARVDYFAFCSHDASAVYLVSYDKMSKHCKNMAKSVVFGNQTTEKLLISDDWVKSQIMGNMQNA